MVGVARQTGLFEGWVVVVIMVDYAYYLVASFVLLQMELEKSIARVSHF